MSSYSMTPTIRYNQRPLVLILPALRGTITHGTIVYYTEPKNNATLISRIVALEGDTVTMKKGLVYVNGKAVDDAARIAKLKAAHCFDENLAQNNEIGMQGKQLLKVPIGIAFVLSDNRSSNFVDSRYFGPILLNQMKGVVKPNPESSQAPLTHAECIDTALYP